MLMIHIVYFFLTKNGSNQNISVVTYSPLIFVKDKVKKKLAFALKVTTHVNDPHRAVFFQKCCIQVFKN